MIAINTLDELRTALSADVYRSGALAHLLADVGTSLTRLGIAYDVEHRMAAGLIADFFLPDLGVVIQCRVQGHPAAIHNELGRYAEQRQVEGVLLMSNRDTHAPKFESLKGKPVAFLLVRGGSY